MVTLEGKNIIAPTAGSNNNNNNKAQTLYERPQRSEVIENQSSQYNTKSMFVV